MKTLFIIIIILSSCSISKVYDIKTFGSIEFDYLEGLKTYNKKFKGSIIYPESLVENKITGRIYYQLTIDRKGQVSNTKILNSNNQKFSNEVLRCLKFVENGWRIKLDSNLNKIEYLVRDNIYFELR